LLLRCRAHLKRHLPDGEQGGRQYIKSFYKYHLSCYITMESSDAEEIRDLQVINVACARENEDRVAELKEEIARLQEKLDLQVINVARARENEDRVAELKEEIARLQEKLLRHLCLREYLNNTAEIAAALGEEVAAALGEEAPAAAEARGVNADALALQRMLDTAMEKKIESTARQVELPVPRAGSCAPSTAQELCAHGFVYCRQGNSRVPFSDKGFVCPECGLLCDLGDRNLCGVVCEGCGVKPHWDLYDPHWGQPFA
jgi:hypothetical protein